MLVNTVIYPVICSFVLAYVISYVLLRNSDKFRKGRRIYSERVRLHKKGVPRLGGLAIYLAFFITLFMFYIFKRSLLKGYEVKIAGIFLASTLTVLCGLYDDLVRRLSYKIKFTIQILAVSIIAFFGYRISVITNPFDGLIYIGSLGIVFVIIWMITIMNAINLIDGLDGLACGVSVIVCMSFLIMAYRQGHVFTLLIVTSAIGAGLGFLRYNFYPAKLFLGDSGSLFLGFILGILAIESSIKRATAISLIIPLLTLFIPITSIFFTFTRRIAGAKNPFKPDNKHLHYRFLRTGLSHRDVVLIYYSVTLIYAILGTFCFYMPKKYEVAIIAFAMMTMWMLYMWALHFISLREQLRRKKMLDGSA
jgi:UDP-GlcNAc:undecaprenyl-phosphate GlcNAc-1-phosphate transferase